MNALLVDAGSKSLRRVGTIWMLCLASSSALPLSAAEPQRLAQVEELSRLSLEDLAKVEVTSVSKSSQLLSTAAAAIYVITREEILRQGVTSIPEALRLAPNLQVEQLGASFYAITARGFGNREDAQAQANKLLILVDGRSVYSPLFSGVFYDAIDVVMDDIDRIEVISGPGATLWGANAMNGVINIITRPASETQGGLVRLDGGNFEKAGGARFGGKMGEELSYRVYAKTFERDSLEQESGASAEDRWNKRQGGFRLDWQRASNAVTVQGDGYHADESVLAVPDISISGANALARWEHTSERSALMVQGYYDRVEREAPIGGAGFTVDTYDVEIQQSIRLGSRHSLVWGAGKRYNELAVVNIGPLQFLPPKRSLDQGNVFAQDTISLGTTFKLTAGIKLEDNAFSGWTALPDLRLSWSPSESMLLWAAASRGIRAPTPFDVDVAEFVNNTLFLQGNPEFRSERVDAFEIGYRGQPSRFISLSVSAFYDKYDDLRSVELGPTIIPLLWGNGVEGNTYGLEAWANVQVRPWWRLSPGVRVLHKRLRFDEGSSGLVGVGITGNDPTNQASLKSSMDFGRNVSLDMFLRHVGDLPQPATPDYYELSARLAWRVSSSLDVSVSGFNLLHDRHLEYAAPSGAQITRSVLAEVRFSF